MTPPSESMRKYANYSMVGRALGDLIVETTPVENLTKLQAGKIKGISTTYDAEVRKETADRIAKAKEVAALEAGSDEQLALMKKYGFESKYSYNVIISCSEKTEKTYSLYLSSISFGDLAFIGAPYEMFDNNGVQIKDGSPFNTTFILTGAGGYWAYMPSIEYCTEYGGYEVDDTQFAYGTAEKLVDEYLKLLKQHKGIS